MYIENRENGASLDNGALSTGRETAFVVICIIMHCESDLLHVVAALQACGRLASLLHCGEQQANEHGDDSDHHQQLNQGESPPLCGQDPSDSHGCLPPYKKLRCQTARCCGGESRQGKSRFDVPRMDSKRRKETWNDGYGT